MFYSVLTTYRFHAVLIISEPIILLKMSRRDDRGGGGRDGGRGPPPDITKMVSLKVDGLSHRSTIEDLESLFEKYGRIGDVYIPKDYRTKESRGFGFVRYYSK